MIKAILSLIINILIVLVLVHAIGSWIPQIRKSGFYKRLDNIVEPILRPIRRILPTYANVDFSPLVLLLILYLIKSLLKL
ncbi:YggT family protein [Thermocrinis jamiesonii]|uniref:YggT family protein n=1 Tax=Thermocrinis jamiesonii TaxID=1302351 RepID=UPI0004967897|nr:YggT family protein [Thermocrinis jamiesonii]